jgi:lipopolysaccharide kinase (Kdo/WaaP) family protein
MQGILDVRVRASRSPGAKGKPPRRIRLQLPERFHKREERTAIWIGEVEPIGEAVFKAYIHRNFWFHFLSPFWSLCAQREYQHLHVLHNGGVPCTVPLLWGRGRSPVHGRFEILATREIRGARSFRDRYRQTGKGPSPKLISEASRTVRLMHERGVYHGALSWKNLLASRSPEGEVRVHIADLARSLSFPRSILGSRMARFDLLQFCCHLSEVKGMGACHRFLEEYGMDGPEVRSCIGDLDAYQPDHKGRGQKRRMEFLSLMFLSRMRLAKRRSSRATPGGAAGTPDRG